MAQLCIFYFARVREEIGLSAERVQSTATTVGELRSELADRGDNYAQALGPSQVVRCAVNQDMVEDEAPLHDGDEVAFFPPVTGG